jgi:putative transposase
VTYDPALQRRRSMRLQGRDYAEPGAYFVTICTAGRACILGRIVDGDMALSDAGQVVQTVWNGLPTSHPGARIDLFVVMPNHVHGILWLEPDRVGARFIAPLSLGAVVRAFKARCAREIGRVWGRTGLAIWQRNYHERIVRAEAELDRIRQYIAENPFNWGTDPENPTQGAGAGERRVPPGRSGPSDVMARSGEGRDESRPYTERSPGR